MQYKTLLLLLLVLSLPAIAQQKIYETNRAYNQGDWITYAATRFVRYVSLGNTFVYFASSGGITRYNYFANQWNYPWTVSNGLASNEVYLVAEDANTGFVWAVTEKSISRYEPAAEIWYNEFFDEMGMIQAPVQSIGFDGVNVIVVDSRDNWFKSHNQFFNFQQTQPALNDHIKWFGRRDQRSGLPHFFMDSEFSAYTFNDAGQEIRDHELRTWPVTTWVRDKWGNLWIGTWGLGAGRGDLNTNRLTLLPFGLWDDTVDDIGKDESSFWVGGMQDHDDYTGITRWFGVQKPPVYYEPHLISGFSNPEITSIDLNERFVFFGTLGGVAFYDREQEYWRTLRRVNNLSDDIVNDVVLDSDFLWIATEGGASSLNLSSIRPDSADIKQILPSRYKELLVYDVDSHGDSLWLGTEYGLYLYHKQKQAGFFIGDIDFINTRVFAVSAFDSELWFATDEGVGCLDTKHHVLKQIPERLHSVPAGIHRILVAAQSVWVATDNGVYKYNRFANRWRHYTRMDGLADNRVYSLYLKGNYIWFGTPKGLTRFYWNSPLRSD
ncbi:MAG: hypothetical protein U5R06_18485 [candidate division KSB1 bacterium]|nr:hypothetical protein [candidate division KSB1 bacterium]